jgi:hypothetical protein
MEKSIDSVLAGKYPAKAHAAKVAAHLKLIDPSSAFGIIYLQGQQTKLIEDNDEPQPFRYHASRIRLAPTHLSSQLNQAQQTTPPFLLPLRLRPR